MSHGLRIVQGYFIFYNIKAFWLVRGLPRVGQNAVSLSSSLLPITPLKTACLCLVLTPLSACFIVGRHPIQKPGDAAR
jgi:hypothetical protein